MKPKKMHNQMKKSVEKTMLVSVDTFAAGRYAAAKDVAEEDSTTMMTVVERRSLVMKMTTIPSK